MLETLKMKKSQKIINNKVTHTHKNLYKSSVPFKNMRTDILYSKKELDNTREIFHVKNKFLILMILERNRMSP